MEANARRAAESFRTIGRVARLLELLADSPQPLRLTDVARALEVPFSSTHVLLQALVRLQLAEMSGQGLSREAAEERLAAGIPTHHVIDPGEVAMVIAMLCSPRLKGLTGSNVVIDSGRSLMTSI